MRKSKWEIKALDAVCALRTAHDKMRTVGNYATVKLIESALTMYYFEYVQQLQVVKENKKQRKKR